MANRHRGEVKLAIGGEVFALRLTLQALAEIEAALGADDLQGLGERFAAGRAGARDLIALIGAAVRGGGAKLSDAAVAERMGAEELPDAVAALGELFALSFGADDSKRPRAP
ncbi:MAG: gene transfer agent family protein [Rhizobiales bacterium]|nr:gene transfer agent family protein [Hyphomicrobiales bacterium]